MIGLKRFVRHDVIVSVVAHFGLLLCLFLVGAGRVPAVPPEPLTVDIIPSDEAPQMETKEAAQDKPNVEGTPLESSSSGSELVSDSAKGSAVADLPGRKSGPPSLQQAQAAAKPQRQGSSSATEQAAASPEPQPPETEPQASEPLLHATAPADRPQPKPQDAAVQPNPSDMFAMMMAIPALRFGGVDPPAPDPAMAPHDDIAAFMARLNSCAEIPSGLDENAAIAVRLSFKRDGTLASPPKLLDASLSPDVGILLHITARALERCQPFIELPADKYKKWKTLDLVFPLPVSFHG